MVWAAFLLSVVAYPSGLMVIVHRWRPAYDSALLAQLQMRCLLGGIAQTLVAFLLFQRAGGADAPSLSKHVTAWALADAIGIYGLILGLWRARPELSTIFFTWAIVLLLVMRPPAARRPALAPPAPVD